MIFVSHDRYFVDRLATKVIEVGGGQAPLYPGGYEDFLYWKKQQAEGAAAPLPTPPKKPVPHLRESATAQAAVAPAEAPQRTQKPAKAPDKEPAQNAKSGGNGDRPGYDPLAPRLRPPQAPQDRQARERELRKAKARVVEIEKRIGEKEQEVKDLEHLMASPGFYDDRKNADDAVSTRQKLLDEVAALMTEWETLQGSLASA
jgi:ATP-binding cassette subfamily F protein 3